MSSAAVQSNASVLQTPQQQQQQHPQYPPSAMATPRTAPRSPSNTYAEAPPVTSQLPIRSSSSSHHSPAQASPHDTRGYTSRSSRPHTQPQPQAQPGYGSESDSDRPRAHRSPPHEQSGTSRSRRTQHPPTSSRSATADAPPPMGADLPRENSAVITRLVVDDPQADLAREEARQAEARPQHTEAEMAAADTAHPAPVPRSRQDNLKNSSSQHRKEVKFGNYVLGQTIGSGEFGKVKIGWKNGSTVQVAVKLIRKDQAGSANRLGKIYREIEILKELKHPNIVRLHEYIETNSTMGIILEYASGGELFDYILTHRYLKDPAARRLFAQLISGVGYLHEKGIVHRDLKLENLLLDRNKHIIITDFGFANTFDPSDELADDVVSRITDKDYVKRMGLNKTIRGPDGQERTLRRGDLMQTSCGSPCYAAPELVVHDGLYTGRKVDVWSCGVILYAMLAGYLPFDDDPANPDGDNINLLYKYICSTPLTFPEYVTPHARDLLRRILQPEPRDRADLFEVARHSWLADYTHVVGFIGSRVTSAGNKAPMGSEDETQLGRSASVREPNTRSAAATRASVAGPRHIPAASMGGDEANDYRARQHRDNKRNTVQIEPAGWEPPPAKPSATRRERSPEDEAPSRPVPMPAGASSGKTRAASGPGPVEITTPRRPDNSMAPPPRPATDSKARVASDPAFASSLANATSRPNTSGTLGAGTRLPSRGNSYSQPVAAQPTNTNVQGSFSQPRPSSGIFLPPGEPAASDFSGRPYSEQNRMGSGQFQPSQQQPHPPSKPTGHRRSSTLGSIADRIIPGRSNSRRISQQQAENGPASNEKRDRRYPPVSMNNAMPQANEDAAPRSSSDSRRPSLGFGRKSSRERDSSAQGPRSSRRFSGMFGLFGGGRKDQGYESGDDGYRPPPQQAQQSRRTRPQSKGMAFGRGTSETSLETADSPRLHADASQALYQEPDRDRSRANARQYRQEVRDKRRSRDVQYDKSLPPSPGADQAYGAPAPTVAQYSTPPPVQRKQFRDDGYGSNALDQQQEPSERYWTPSQDPDQQGSSAHHHGEQYNLSGHGEWQQYEAKERQSNLRPNQRKFGYEDRGHGGSSSAARKVMGFFRRKKDVEA